MFPTSSSTNCTGIVHKLVKGDTCWSISQSYNYSLETLQSNYDCDKLIPGQNICLN